MKKKFLVLATVAVLCSSMMFTSCIGSFGAFHKVLKWNKGSSSKFVNELVFFAFWIIPVYEITCLADILVINSIEFWSGSNPVSASTKVIDGKDAKYLVKCDSKGYTITNLTDNSVVTFAFDGTDNSWSLINGDESYKLMTFVDDSHVKMIAPNGGDKIVELSQQGVWAYQNTVLGSNMAMR